MSLSYKGKSLMMGFNGTISEIFVNPTTSINDVDHNELPLFLFYLLSVSYMQQNLIIVLNFLNFNTEDDFNFTLCFYVFHKSILFYVMLGIAGGNYIHYFQGLL